MIGRDFLGFACVLTLAACSKTTRVEASGDGTSGASGAPALTDSGGTGTTMGSAGATGDSDDGGGGSGTGGGASAGSTAATSSAGGTEGTGGVSGVGGVGGSTGGTTAAGGTTGTGGSTGVTGGMAGEGGASDTAGAGGSGTGGSGTGGTGTGGSGTGGTGTGGSGTGGSGTGGSGGTTTEPVFKRVFVTSGRYSGDLHTAGAGTSGVAGADNICNTLASNAGLGGTWRAWLSVGVGAFDRITTEAAWHLLDADNTEVFPSRSSLQAPPVAPIDVNENGIRLTSATHVWTGTLATGQPAGTNALGRCASWNAGTATAGIYGDMKSSGTQWTNAGLENCDNNTNRLYCFEL